MFDWISHNSEMLQVMLNGMMVVIWIAYLQIFFVSFRRQQRSKILINMSVGSGLSARCCISNLSLEPLYLYDVVVELTTKAGTREAVITDRTEMTDEQVTITSQGTNQGPLNSGDSIDIGSFNDIIERASRKLEGVDLLNVTHFQITALAQTSSSPQVIGAYRKYCLHKCDGMIDISPLHITATQVRFWWGRRQLRLKMKQRLHRN